MTKYYQNLINKLKADKESPEKDHHIFLLGTDVAYVDKPNDTDYIRGETFSYAAQLTSHLLGEDKDVIKFQDAIDRNSENYAHAYHSPSVDVINGADTFGKEAGDRIAKALLLALGAVAEGKDYLHLAGFSRGGVEAIVLTHELERVKTELAKDLGKDPKNRQTLAKIIAESFSVPGMSFTKHPSYTREALMKLVNENQLDVTNKRDEDEEAALKQKLLTNLEKMRADLFVLDPVPGGNAKVIQSGWYEKNEDYFYTLPDFVENKQEFVQQHETSNCFKPIVPRGIPYEVIPGCHGTADGNQGDDQGKPIPPEICGEKPVSGAQDMVLRRWIDFTFPGENPKGKIDLGHTDLDAVANEYMAAKKDMRDVILVKNYKEMSGKFACI